MCFVCSQRRAFSMHYHCIHWHAPLFYKCKAGAWHQQMPACFISVSLWSSWQRGDTICPPGGGGSDKGSQAPPAVRNDFLFSFKDDSLKNKQNTNGLYFIPSYELKSSFNTFLRRYVKIKFGLNQRNNGRKYGLISQLRGVPALPKSRGAPRKSRDPQHLSRAAVWQM